MLSYPSDGSISLYRENAIFIESKGKGSVYIAQYPVSEAA